MKNWPAWAKILLIVVIVFSCVSMCCCLVLAGLVIYSEKIGPIDGNPLDINLPTYEFNTEETPEVVFPTEEETNEPLITTPEGTDTSELVSWDTLTALENEDVPINDLRELARRLGGKGEIPVSVETPALPAEVGDTRKFWVSNMDTDENFQVDASLVVRGDTVYFWVENGVDYKKRDVQALVDAFDEKIFPTNRTFFGMENSPGVDGEDRLFILYASNIGSTVAGYFSSADAVHPLAHPYSNAHEMFVMSADNAPLSDNYTFGVLAHEYQHMIHWNLDRNEETWLNEGFSELASYLNGYDPGSAAYSFASDPDIQLNYWPEFGETYVHYGSSYLFVSYILDRFGSEFTQALVKDASNGMDSLDNILRAKNIVNSQTGKPLTADEVYSDWAIANILNDTSVQKGQYGYSGGTDVPTFFPNETYSYCPSDWENASVSQYGTDYLEFDCEGSFTLQFQGVGQVGILPENAFSGDFAFWSNRGDESDMTMTREFDLTQVTGDVNLKYKVWFEIEELWDYAYLEVSDDGGKTWTILETKYGTSENPQGNAYGWGYSGSSNGWQEEFIDFSEYAGKSILIRFEYITDAAVNLDGLMVDDIELEAAGYFSDFETDDGGWDGQGFVRIQNKLPQTFAVSIIKTGVNPEVQTFLLTETRNMSVPVEIGGGVDSVILVVSGTTRFTTQPAIYRYKITDK